MHIISRVNLCLNISNRERPLAAQLPDLIRRDPRAGDPDLYPGADRGIRDRLRRVGHRWSSGHPWNFPAVWRVIDGVTRRSFLLFIAMSVIWGLPYLFIGIAGHDLSPVALVFARTAIGALILLPLVVWRGELRGLFRSGIPLLAFASVDIGVPWLMLTSAEQKITSSPHGAIEAVAVLAVVCTAVAFVLFFALIAAIGPVRATVITYINPAVAALLGVTVLHENFTIGMAVGFVLVIAGSVLATRGRRAAAPAAVLSREGQSSV